MTLVRNLVLFLVLFVPSSCVTGLAGGFLTGPSPTPRIAYELGLFLFPVMPLLLPSILIVPVLHFVYRGWAHRRSPREMRRIATLATPAALLAVHLIVFGVELWSLPLVALFVVPGLLYGSVFGIPRVGDVVGLEPSRSAGRR